MSDSIAEAYINIRAKDGGLHDDVKDMGQRAGAAGGEAGGKTFGDKFTEAGSKELARDSSGRFTAAGQQTGATFADGFTKGADGKLRDAQGRFAAGLGGDGSGSGGGSFWGGLGGKSGKEFSEGLGKGLKVGFAGVGGSALGATALNSIGVLSVGTATAVKQLSGSLLLLPAAGAAAAATFATLKIGTSGFGDALKALGSGDADGVADALRKLTPEARSAFLAIDDLTPAVGRLRRSVEGRLFAGIGPEISDLGGKYLPVAATGFGKIAEAANRAGLTFADFAEHTKPLHQVAQILDNTALSAGNLREILPSVTRVFLTLSQVGSSFLPAGAKSLDDAAEHLADTVDRLAQTGQLKAYIGGGLDAAKALVEVLGNASQIVGEIFKAGGAGNDAPLQTLANLLGSVADQIARPEFQAGLGDVFAAIAYAADQVDGVLPDVADALAALAPAIEHLVRGSGDALATTLQIIAGTAQALAPALNLVAVVLDHLGGTVGVALAAMLGLKGALAGLAAADKARGGLAKLDAGIVNLTGSSKAAGTAMGGLSKAASALALVGVAEAISSIGKEMFTATVATDQLAASLDGLGSGGDPGKGLSDLFSTGGLFGQNSNIDATNKALEQFGTTAKHALDPDLFRRILHDGSGDALKNQIGQLDTALADLVNNGHADQAAASFKQLTRAAEDSGVDVSQLAPKFEQYAKAVASAAPKLAGLDGGIKRVSDVAKIADGSLRSLTLTTLGYATAILSARGDSRAFQAAIDQANESIRQNGHTMSETTAKGRANAEALDAIASAGLALAKDVPEGADAQVYFASTLAKTRRAVIAAGTAMTGSKSKAEALATSILGIPAKAATKVTAPGINQAINSADDLKNGLAGIPRQVSTHVSLTGYAAVAAQVNDLKNGFALNALAGARAAGGSVLKGQTYLVGEQGPELFTAATSGTILSAGATKKAAAGLDDLTTSQANRRQAEAPAQQPGSGPVRLHQDDLDYLGSRIERAVQRQRIYLDSGQLVGAIDRAGGQTL